MAHKAAPPSQADLRSLLDYDCATGIFTWRARPVELFSDGKRVRAAHKAAIWNKRWPGTVAGANNGRGYIMIAINDHLFLAHRLAWLYVHGEWPHLHIDHINGIRDDNRIGNLRLASRSENSQNMKKQAGTTSKYMGVSWAPKSQMWHAEIMLHKCKYDLGYWEVEEDAAAAYLRAKERLHTFSPTGKRAQFPVAA